MEKNTSKSALSTISDWIGNENSMFSKLRLCSCCGVEKPDSPEEKKLIEKSYATVEDMNQRITLFEKNTQVIVEALSKQNPGIEKTSFLRQPVNPKCTCGASAQKSEVSGSKVSFTKQDIDRNAWINNVKILGNRENKLDANEEEFWKRMITKYLKPLKETGQEKRDSMIGLKTLRNKVVFAFFMLNSIFILVVFMLQLNKDQLYISWPIDPKVNITYLPNNDRVIISKDFLHLEPVGTVFAIFFGAIMLVQFLGMLTHRWGTFTHIMADTTLKTKHVQSDELEDVHSEESDFEEADGFSMKKRMSINPANRRVSHHFLQVGTINAPKYKSMDEARQFKRRKQSQQMNRLSTKSRDSIFLRKSAADGQRRTYNLSESSSQGDGDGFRRSSISSSVYLGKSAANIDLSQVRESSSLEGNDVCRPSSTSLSLRNVDLGMIEDSHSNFTLYEEEEEPTVPKELQT